MMQFPWSRSPNLKQWAEECRLFQPERTDLLHLLEHSDEENLHAFAQLCHDLVLDRDVSFTLQRRIGLYRRWLTTKQPCLIAVDDGHRQIVAASIVLSLTEDAYHAFWSGRLDALDISGEHLSRFGDELVQHRYFLVDMLARNKRFIRHLPESEQGIFCGVGFRTMLYHLSLFLRNGQSVQPLILCSTLRRDLGHLLQAMGFERRLGQGGAIPIFAIDLEQRSRLSPDAQWLFAGTEAVIQGYLDARRETGGISR